MMMSGRIQSWSCVLAAMLTLAALCGTGWAQGEAGAAPPTAQPLGAAKAKRVLLDRVVAVVDDAVILHSELMGRLVPVLAGLETIDDARERQRRQENLTSQMLEEMIAEELIIQAAKAASLSVDAKEINAAVAEIKQQNNLDDAALAAALAQQGYTMETYRRDVERQILRMRAINMLVRPRVTVTDEDVRARYDAMLRRSAAVSKVHLQHVLIALPENPSGPELAAAKERAAQVIARAKAGTPFTDLAREYSDDVATRESGGDLGWIDRGSIATEWEVIVFAMDKGEVRGPISGPRGLHVFHVSDLARSDVKPFDELKEQLRSELYRKEMEKQTDAWILELREKAFIDTKL